MSNPTARWRAMVAVIATLGVGGLASCGAPRPGISNGSVTACYRAIPKARAAIHDSKATVISVHRVPADRVKPHLPPAAQAQLDGDNDTSVCAVAFKGSFLPGQVELAPTDEQGKYALVLIGTHHLQLLTSAVLNKLPSDLGKRTL
jgi:hypothetical protein